MLERKSEEFFEKELCRMYLKAKKSGGRAHCESIRRWIHLLPDSEYNSIKSQFNIGDLSRKDLYDKLESISSLFTGKALQDGNKSYPNMIWDFQIYTIIDHITNLPNGVYLVTEKEQTSSRLKSIEKLTGLKIKKIDNKIYSMAG